MSEKLYNFFCMIFPFLKQKSTSNETPALLPGETLEEATTALAQLEEENSLEDENEEKINAAKRTLMTKLYALEQEITVFENDFPDEHHTFMERIEGLRQDYNSGLEETKKLLTFGIDPELDGSNLGKFNILAKDIRKFIECEVKFNIISKRLQRLIAKLNILYNVSIFHFSEGEKAKVMSQTERALDTEKTMANELKTCDYILSNRQLKERLVNLFSYVDYEIFKSSIRNSKEAPAQLIKKLTVLVKFEDFDYVSAFVAFIKDEISDLGELLPLVVDEGLRKVLTKKQSQLLRDITYADDVEKLVVDSAFWDSFLEFESSFLELLKANGVEKDRTKVKLIDRMEISVNETDVIVLPKTNAYLSLISIFSATHDNRILLLIKLLRNVSDDVTFKEIYFLIVLFDGLGVLQNTSNDLVRYIEKYLQKYPYNKQTIMDKKKSVIYSSSKEYLVAFLLDDYVKEIITTLEELNIDFKIEGDKVLINSFYFKGLENVLSSLRNNTTNNI